MVRAQVREMWEAVEGHWAIDRENAPQQYLPWMKPPAPPLTYKCNPLPWDLNTVTGCEGAMAWLEEKIVEEQYRPDAAVRDSSMWPHPLVMAIDELNFRIDRIRSKTRRKAAKTYAKRKAG